MLGKLGTFILVVTIVALLSPVILASVEGVEGVKGSAPHDTDAVAAPASSEWGMFIMGLLVMTASTALLLGGHNQGAWRFTAPTVRSDGSAPERRGRAPRSSEKPRSKMRRGLSALRSQQAQQAKGRNVTPRGSTHTKLRRRGGPGCRGVR
ncbi:MAG: hypothetical protein JRF63_11750 [Deltaproteobacteria bacterium]|nr:hypothetical protein [Deltaproteobacteria bacterium]